jgi:[acyl-carrier-protein] S-malonyltransferase
MPVTAALFPGQGSQTNDMRQTVEAERPDLLELALEIVGDDPFERAGDGTRFTQPAIYCTSLAGWSRIGAEADLLAGHSLGEIAALAASGALSDEDGLRLVALRGRVMEEAAAAARPGGMLAVGAPRERIAPLAERLGLALANDNGPHQVVLAGDVEALEEATRIAREEGLRAKLLPVAGAFHSPAMRSAVPEFEAELARVELRPPRIEVLSCVTAAPAEDPRGLLAAALTRPVRWRETLLALRERGAERFVETGPGRVLTGLVRRTLGDVEVEAPLEAARA